MLGCTADDYLWAHGYEPGSIRIIQQEYERADEVNDFVDNLAAAGMAVTEARYLYALIHDRNAVEA